MSMNHFKPWLHPVHLLAFGFGSGLSPKAPGTVGSLAAIPFYFLLAQLPNWGYLLCLALASIIGVYLCGKTSRDMGVHDHGGIVWDEFVGVWITLFMLPEGWYWLLAGFLLFRLFDILKPFPIGYLDKHIHGGTGIMLDDIIAGIFAWLCLFGAQSLI